MPLTHFVSVIIPVYNDAPRLRLCLDAIAHQTYGADGAGADGADDAERDAYEVIVVDNASDPEQGIPALVGEYPFAVYVFESAPGAYTARNRGLTVAKGDVLAFTDADCIPAADWLEKGVGHLARIEHCGLVAGQVKIFFRSQKGNAVELYESVTAFPQRQLLAQYQGAATANVFTFKAVMDAVGPFNTALRSHGDLEWGHRVYLAGYAQFLADDTCVAHPARYTFDQLRTRTLRLAGGAFGRAMEEAPANNAFARHSAFARLLVGDLLPPVNFALSSLKDARLHGWREKLTVVLVLCWVRYHSALEKVRLRLGHEPERS